jgi:hypothetical protein
MIHNFPKLISKVMALRLALKLDVLVDQNQNAFIRSELSRTTSSVYSGHLFSSGRRRSP